MLWEVKLLPKPEQLRAPLRQDDLNLQQQEEEELPSKPPALTKWNDLEHYDESKGFCVNPEAEAFYKTSGDILFYPALTEGCEDLRNTFYMQRRRRPIVPAPSSCPMPDKQRSDERLDRLYLFVFAAVGFGIIWG